MALAALALALTLLLGVGQNNTGTNGVGTVFPDPYYTLVAAPSPLVPGPAYGTPPNPAWVAPSPSSNWINPYGWDNLGAPTSGSTPLPYDYQTMFAFGGTVDIAGEMAADDAACLYANGLLVLCTPKKGFTQYTHFVIPSSDLVPGNNMLDFKVYNLILGTGLLSTFFCPASFGTPTNIAVYNDGLANATVNAWSINNGYVVSDSFQLAAGANNLTALCFYAWVSPIVDVPNTVDLSITSAENGGTTYFNQTLPLTCAQYCTAGQALAPPNYPYSGTCGTSGGLADVYGCTALFSASLNAGTYWLNLQSATTTPAGGFVFWDENSGPSLASSTAVGTIPAESFAVYGH